MKETKQVRRLGIRASLPPDPSSEEQLKLYMRAGFNILTMTEDFVRAKSKAYLDCLRRCERLGLDVYVRGYPADIGDYYEKHFTGVDFNDYPAVTGFYVLDEPSLNDIDAVARYVPWFNDRYAQTGKNFYLNTYCGTNEGQIGDSVTDYMNLLMQKIYNKLNTENKYLTIDEYPLRRGMDGKAYLDGREWIPYTALTAKICRDNGVRFGAYMQTFGGGYCDARRPLTIEELRFMAYVYLAFGAQHLGYFVYMSSGEWDFLGIVDEGGKPTDLYYLVRKLNEELLSFDVEYLSYDWKGALVVDGAKNETPNKEFIQTREFLPYTDAELAEVKAEKDLIVGCFEKGKNECAYIVVSYGEPTVREGNVVELIFKTAKKLSVQRNGVKETVEIKDGKLKLEMKQGEGIYIQTLK